jgi:uncharacterized LabA/DUF88 family protein
MNDQLAIFIDFENIALWAEREFFDFKVTSLIEYLQSRGPAVVKRAYADWSRFSRYRDEMMNNSIDLIQIYSVRSGKNRADIRMAIDAFEIALTRTKIQTFVIISGDSDFSPLVAKLREYGHYTIGIGPRGSTHDLLVRSCDEFIYLETALGEFSDVEDQSSIEIEEARSLLIKAITAHGQRGDIPVLATRLKQTMLLMDPAFNEANFGYSQFKTWLEDNSDLVEVINQELQLYVSPANNSKGISPSNVIKQNNNHSTTPQNMGVNQASRETIDERYKQILIRMNMKEVNFATRRDVLRDIYRELSDHPGNYTTDELLDLLEERYEAQELLRTKVTLRHILQLALHQGAFDYYEQPVSPYTPVQIAPSIESEANFVERAESDIIYAVIRAGLEVDLGKLAYLLLNDHDQMDYIQVLLDDLVHRNMINQNGERYNIPGNRKIPFANEPILRILIQDIELAELPDNIDTGFTSARLHAKKAMVQRSQDFAASSDSYLLACRLQWDAIESGEPGATLEDLRWYMASYASAIAGKLSQVNRDYASARPYYLAFFALVQEGDVLWSRMRGLINPMLAYYWSNAGRELDINVNAWNLSMASPAQIAVYAASHPDPDLRKKWYKITFELAKINSGILRRIMNQLMLSRSEFPENENVATQIEDILQNVSPA